MPKENKSKIADMIHFLTYGMWITDITKLGKFSKFLISILRVISTTLAGILKNRIPIQAASLSYTTLLALGPIIALAILISGIFFKDKGEAFLYDKINNALVFIMPAITQMPDVDDTKINPEILGFIEKISQGSASLGFYGILVVVITCILLCVNMENAFNSIWSVEKGRKWLVRFTFYWMMITLGVVLGIGGMTFLTTSQLGNILKDIPFFHQYANWGIQMIGIGSIVVALAMFYKFMPNTHVKIFPSFVGAIIVALSLMLNNKLSFIYIGNIIKQQTFYGYLAIIPVALFSLYIFWLFILLGAEITYAVQNIDFLSSRKMWSVMGSRVRTIIAFSIFAEVSRNFYNSKDDNTTISYLSEKLKIPSAIINNCINILEEKKLICEVENKRKENGDPFYTPAISPDSITLAGFLKIFTTVKSDNMIFENLLINEPSVKKVMNSFEDYNKTEIASKSIKELL